MDSRTAILNKIKKALSDVDKTQLQEPALPRIWDKTGKTREELIEIFSQNLTSVAGQPVVCENDQDAYSKIASVLSEIASKSERPSPYRLGVYPSAIAQETAKSVLATLDNWIAYPIPEDQKVDPKTYEPMTASLVTPLLLLSDTGSCAVEGRTAYERLLCYLSPVCLVVARASQLREHLPDAWDEIETKLRTPGQTGEIALITGPSRTADIEKKLVLGVHGPQRLIVFILKD